jgi:hypothetical protein
VDPIVLSMGKGGLSRKAWEKGTAQGCEKRIMLPMIIPFVLLFDITNSGDSRVRHRVKREGPQSQGGYELVRERNPEETLAGTHRRRRVRRAQRMLHCDFLVPGGATLKAMTGAEQRLEEEDINPKRKYMGIFKS